LGGNFCVFWGRFFSLFFSLFPQCEVFPLSTGSLPQLLPLGPPPDVSSLPFPGVTPPFFFFLDRIGVPQSDPCRSFLIFSIVVIERSFLARAWNIVDFLKVFPFPHLQETRPPLGVRCCFPLRATLCTKCAYLSLNPKFLFAFSPPPLFLETYEVLPKN